MKTHRIPAPGSRNACACVNVSHAFTCVHVITWTVTRQALLSMNSPGKNIPPPGDVPNPGIEPRSPALQADSLPPEPPGMMHVRRPISLSLDSGIFPYIEKH